VITDIVIGLQHGDEGKGKVTHHLLKKGEYTHCIRFNGSCNAGHTIYHEGKRFVTHHIPAGVFFGVKSIVGPGCVLNIDKFFEELQYLKSEGIDTENLVKVASNTHIIRQSHIDEDSREYKIGTTKSGNGPAYRDKYGRHGLRAESVEALSPFIIDIIEELYSHDDPVILMEGAQGFSLDIDWGDYPFVTSSHTGTAGAILNGIDPRSIRDVWGVAKVYETYVGNRVFQPDSPLFNDIQRVGKEVGATTGRPRQCNWLDCGQLQTAIKINGVNNLVINKMDILREIGVWGVRNPYLVLGSEEEMMKMIHSCCPPSVTSIFYSDSPEFI
tara:strand:+ start:2537 stop:3520 length:984 start_codon:yes stop_codon:yes gene_type:complete